MPERYEHIACCTDGRPGSLPVIEEAARVRGGGPGRLSLVHVLQWPLPYATGFGGWMPGGGEDIRAHARRRVEQQAARVPGAEAVVLEGRRPAEIVADWAREQGVDLLVVGATRTAIERATLGSFAGRLAERAPCALLVVRPGSGAASAA
jgi:nucleotide-binding universal stress UspA family protein